MTVTSLSLALPPPTPGQASRLDGPMEVGFAHPTRVVYALLLPSQHRRCGVGDLDGRGVVITGGAGDIGAAMGRELSGHGAAVTLVDRKPPEEAEPWVERARGGSGKVRYAEADVRDRDALDGVFAGLDPFDVAIGNAGIVDSAPFLEITEEQWQNHLDVNLTG